MIKNTITASFVFISLGLFAQQDLTLKQAQELAVQNAYQVKLSEAEVTKAKQKVKETTAIGLPQISGEVSFQNMINIPTQLAPADAFGFPDWMGQTLGVSAMQYGIEIPQEDNSNVNEEGYTELQFGTKNNLTPSVTASQLIFSGEYLVGLQASKAYVGTTEKQLTKSKETVKESATNAYYSVLIAKEAKEVTKNTLDKLQKIHQETEELFKAGFIEEIDLDQINYTLTFTKASQEKTESQYKTALKYLNFQLGQDINSDISVSETLQQIIDAISYDDLSNSNLNIENNIDYQLLQSQKELTTLSLKREKAVGLPTLAGFFTHQEVYMSDNFKPFSGQYYPTTLWGLKLNVPLFSSGQQYFKTAQAKVDLEKSDVQIQQVTEGLKVQMEKAKSDLAIAYNDYNVQKQNLELAQKIQNNTFSKFKEGVASSLELTQTQSQYLQTQASYIGSIFSLLTAKSSLDKVLGNYK